MKPNHQQSRGPRGLQRAGALLALSVGAALIGAQGNLSSGQEDDADSKAIESARSGIDTWVELRGQIGKEKAQLAERKAFLADRIELMQGQIEDARAENEERTKTVAESRSKRDELEAENEKLKAASASLSEIIAGLEARTLGLLKRMPAPLVDQVQPVAQNIPVDPDAAEMSLSKRFTYVVGVLTAIDKFNTDVHLATETVEIVKGSSAQVTALYLGISQAYYVTSDGSAAGRGSAGDDSFKWSPINEAAPQIQEAVKVMNGALPSFIQVPIVID